MRDKKNKLKDALTLETSRMTAVFDDFFIPLILTDINLDTIKKNKAAESFFGLNNEISAISPDLYRKSQDFLSKSSITFSLELAFNSRQLLIQVTKITNKDILFTFQDISKEFYLSEQLRQAQKMEAIGQLSSGIAHDFNNLLTIIGGYSKLIRKKELNKDVKEYAERINATIDRGTSMIRNLLSFTRCSKTNYAILNINSMTQNIVTLAGHLLNDNVTISLSLYDKDLSIMGDEVQLEHCLLNLIANAQDAMDKGGKICISTSVAAFDEVNEVSEIDSDYVLSSKAPTYSVITVLDNGAGIEQENINSIFDPFFTTKPPQKGTGLGLVMVNDIIKHHRGKIVVESQKHIGTTFKIYLPLAH